MFDYLYDLYALVIESSASNWSLYLLYGLLLFLFGSSLYLVYFVGRKLFANTNYTMRKLLSLRHKQRSSSGKIKRWGRKNSLFLMRNIDMLQRIYLNNKLILEKGGLYSHSFLLFIIATKWILIPSVALLAFYTNAGTDQGGLIYGLISLLLLELGLWAFLRYQIKTQADNFKVESYRLFKFLRNQLSAGVRISQALNALPMVARDPLLKTRLLLMASHYSSTNDIDEALNYVRNYYQTLEANSLALSIKQSIETGRNDQGFAQKEKKLFNMYLNVIKKKTQILMLKYFGIGMLYGVVIILIIGYPQWLDLVEANRILFGN
jgi:Flp pilus assembly protein TadB